MAQREKAVTVQAALLAALGVAATYTDLRSREIPNWIPLLALLSGLVWHAWNWGLHGFLLSLFGTGVGFCVFLVFYWLGGMGGGDIKLMGGFGALVGMPGMLPAVFWVCVFGGVIASAVVIWQWRRSRLGGGKSSRGAADDSIPYAPAIVLGVWVTLWMHS